MHCFRPIVLFLTCLTLLPAAPVQAGKAGGGGGRGGAASVEALLAARSEDDKCHIFMRMRNSLTADQALKIVTNESSQAIAAMAVGCYLETGNVEPAQAAVVLLRLVDRTYSYGLPATLGATSGKAVAIADALAARSATGDAPRLAADILATYATICEEGIATAGGGGKRAARRGNRKHPDLVQDNAAASLVLARLLKSKEPGTVETAILAAARLRLKGLQEAVSATAAIRTRGVAAVRLLYWAKIGAPVNEALVKQVFAPEAKTALRGGEKLPPLLTYAIRTPPLTYACEALGELGSVQYLAHLHQALRDSDPHVQIDAARAIERIGSEKSLPALWERVAAPQTKWPALVYVLSAVGAIPAKDSIPVLINRLAQEKGRFGLDVNYALASIVGRQAAMDAKDWKAWWETNEATFVADKQRTRKFREEQAVQDMRVPVSATFYDLDVVSHNVVFVIDTSNSMRGVKLDSAKANLIRTLERLEDGTRFNVVNFGGIVHIMKPAALMVHDEVRRAVEEVRYLEPTLGTRAFDAMELAMSVPGTDTLIVLTDGAPVAGKFCAWPRLTAALGILTRYYPVAIWGVLFDASPGNLAAMQEMTGRNWGRTGSPQP